MHKIANNRNRALIMENKNINEDVREFNYKESVSESEMVNQTSDIYEDVGANVISSCRLNKTKNIAVGIKEYLKGRLEVQKEFEIKKVQQNVRARMFDQNVEDGIELFYYNRDNYEIDEIGVESEESAVESNRVKMTNKITRVEYSDEKENLRPRRKSRGFVDMEAEYSGEDETEEADEIGKEELDDFIDGDEGNIDQGVNYELLKNDLDEEKREVEQLEKEVYRRFDGTRRVRQNGTDGGELEKIESESEESSEIEEMDLADSREKEENATFVGDRSVVCGVGQESGENKPGLKLKNDQIISRLKKTGKKMFRGFDR
ncbi:hypothetical protein ECANGB1_1177 [Enterospora canceri]|uniref:Uncharacterized protein n=1 Tax=Enterospora canceri TaxID=1081671 RepID=A0A1Y1S6L0_9MICR|nr:hypothetical protein ECANGB1_1177 [Enterospora canceri]